jgi:hypothetical protein
VGKITEVFKSLLDVKDLEGLEVMKGALGQMQVATMYVTVAEIVNFMLYHLILIFTFVRDHFKNTPISFMVIILCFPPITTAKHYRQSIFFYQFSISIGSALCNQAQIN